MTGLEIGVIGGCVAVGGASLEIVRRAMVDMNGKRNGKFTEVDRGRIIAVAGVVTKTDEGGRPLVYAPRAELVTMADLLKTQNQTLGEIRDILKAQ